jgi:hemerythrin
MLPWDPTLDTGHAGIDEQHRRLFAKASALLAAIDEGREAAEVKDLLRFLADYVREHFDAEERLMKAAGYPGAEGHAVIHRRIERRLVEVATAWHAHGVTPALLGDVRALMTGWVTIHIGERDRDLAAYLAPRAASGA